MRTSQIRSAAAETWMERALESPVSMDETTAYDPEIEVRAAGDITRWTVQKNMTASNEYREHTVSWDARTGRDTVGETGAGIGTGFLDTLSGGDRIAVIARALVSERSHFPGTD